MKKIILFLVSLILLFVLFILIVFLFNPFNLRTKFIGSLINSYLEDTIPDYHSVSEEKDQSESSDDKNPFLNEAQEKSLEDLGVNVDALPKEVTPEMQSCFIEKLGTARAMEILGGDEPTAIDLFKSRDCIGE